MKYVICTDKHLNVVGSSLYLNNKCLNPNDAAYDGYLGLLKTRHPLIDAYIFESKEKAYAFIQLCRPFYCREDPTFGCIGDDEDDRVYVMPVHK